MIDAIPATATLVIVMIAIVIVIVVELDLDLERTVYIAGALDTYAHCSPTIWTM